MLDQFNHPYILLFLSMFAGSLYSCCSKFFSQRYASNAADNALYTFGTSLVTTVILLAFMLAEGFKGISTFTLLVALAFGVTTALKSIIYIKTLSLGPLSFTTIINSSSSIIPVFYGLFLGQSITIWQIIGIAFMMVSLFFIVEKDKDNRKASIQWLIFALIGFFLGGLIGILQSTHQTSFFRFQINEFLLITFGMSVVVSLVDLIYLRSKGVHSTKNPAINKGRALTLVLGGFGCAFINIVNLYLSGVFPSTLFFPVINGGTLVVTVVVSFTFFRERLNRRRLLGMILGVISLMFLMGIVESILIACGILS